MSDNNANDNSSSFNEVPEFDQTKSTRTCQKCGGIMESSHLGQTCPACLLQVGFESDENQSSMDAAAKSTASDDASWNEEDSLESVQKLFPGLEILEWIGRGGMGIVYKARQKHLGRLVALKVLRAKCSGDPSLAERFTREARALAKLSHPNIVGVHDFGQAGDRPFLIMEYVEGVNLRSMLESKTLNPVEAMAMVPAICEALQFAHDEGVVHRDIKPENILVDRRGRVRIADFGLARLMTRSKDEWTLTGTRQVMGTPHYMAPEQIEHPQEVDHRADIYSLGVVIYEMLTGELPIGRFELPSNKINVDVRFDDIVLRTLEKEPVRRYQHVTEIQTAVESIATDSNQPGSGYPGAIIRTSSAGVTDETFLRIATIGVIVSAIVNAGFAFIMFTELISGPPQTLEFLGAIYHTAISVLLGLGGWQMLTHGPRYWEWTALLAILPIHIGVWGAWPFAFTYLILYLVGFHFKSSKQINANLASGPVAKERSLNDGLAGAVSTLLKFGKRLAIWLVEAWPTIWRKAARSILLLGLWLAFCGLASLSLYWFYGRSRFPTILSIYDQSARSIALSTSEEIRLRIDSNAAHLHSGYTIKTDDLKRSHLQFSLYLASGRIDPRGRSNVGVDANRVYLSEAFNAYLTSDNTIEYEILYPSSLSSLTDIIVEPSVFKKKPIENGEISRAESNVSDRFPSLRNSRLPTSNGTNYAFPNELSTLQFRPKLTNAKPIEKWLASSGMTEEQAAKTAAGLYQLLSDLAQNKGVVPNATGDGQLRPMAEMLDKEIFSPQSGSRISIALATQTWAIEAWVETTIAVCMVGIVAFVAFKVFRTHGARKGNDGPVSVA